MSSFAETHSLYSQAALTALVRDYDRDAVSNRKRISEILQDRPEAFYQAAIDILKTDTDSRAAQYLVALLTSDNLIFRALCDPGLDRKRAAVLARQALRVDPLVDNKLARQLATASADPAGVPTGMAERLLEILDEVTDGRRILGSLMRILRNDNPYLRSKAVLMIGRCGRSLTWIKRRLEESDTRVRANAIEAMWGIDSPEARDLLGWAARDSNNRVVGNALLGLYKLGETSPLADLVKMAGHETPAFRCTAAWVMGEAGDPRFSEVLGRMIADSHKDVRKSAFAAVGRIRSAVAQVTQSVQWQVAGAGGSKNPRTGQRVVSIAVVTAGGREQSGVLPVQFLLTENGQPVWSYRVVEKPSPEPMSVTFLVPRKTDNTATAWDQGALRCLNWKRSTDLWSVVPYSRAENSPAGEGLELPTFVANAARAARVFEETTSRAECTGFWSTVQRAAQPRNTAFCGKRHMIALAPFDVGEPANDKLTVAVCGSRMSVQVISTQSNPALQEFCRRVDGRFHLVEDAATVEEGISQAYLSLLARYEIRYLPVSDAATVKVRIHTPKGWGETLVDQ